jgi:4-hydroxybenzoate polyprenyltransferase
VGILAIALSLETAMQLRLPFCSVWYYVCLFCVTTLYYTYAYIGPVSANKSFNPRTGWYRKNRKFVLRSQRILSAVCVVGCIFIVSKNYLRIIQLPVAYWWALFIILLAALLYYGLLPKSFLKINLRNAGWLKAFVIGFVWACVANVLPLIAVKTEWNYQHTELHLAVWLFVKNFMFCTVNAIMFDIKDYADDANKDLKTFVVCFGLRKTIFFILIPISFVGLLSFLVFVVYRSWSPAAVLLNLVPFAGLVAVAYSLKKQKPIMYYLVVIDGLVFLKALCGIAGMYFIK